MIVGDVAGVEEVAVLEVERFHETGLVDSQSGGLVLHRWVTVTQHPGVLLYGCQRGRFLHQSWSWLPPKWRRAVPG